MQLGGTCYGSSMVRSPLKPVVLLLAARFPSEKAYAVTSRYTMHAVRKLGFRAVIVTPFVGDGESLGLEIMELSNRALRYLRRNWMQGTCSRLNFTLYRCVMAMAYCISSVRPSLTWTRDPLLAIGGLMKRAPVVVEVHRRPTRFDALVIQLISRSRRVHLAVIRLEQIAYFPKARNAVLVAPMAAPDEFWNVPPRTFLGGLTVGYTGKASSTGNDNGIEVLAAAAELAETQGIDLRFRLIGLEADAQEYLSSRYQELIAKGRLTVIGHVDHASILHELQGIDIAVLPYPSSAYYADSFPIKAIEYAATYHAIVASDTASQRALLGDDLAWYFAEGSADSLLAQCVAIAGDPLEAQRRAESARGWSKQFTYRARAQSIIAALGLFPSDLV